MVRVVKIIVVLGTLFCLTDVALACPNCKDGLIDGDPSQSGIVQGFFWSIMIMLATPTLILGGLGSYFYWLIRQAQNQPSAHVARASAGTRAHGPKFELE